MTLAVALVVALAANAGTFEPDPRFAAAEGTTAPDPEPLEDGFRGLDYDRDGRLSLAEAAGEPDIVNRFARADRNRDGRLTKAEYRRLLKLKPRKPRKPGRR